MGKRRRSIKQEKVKIFRGVKSRVVKITLRSLVTVALVVGLIATGYWVFTGPFFAIRTLTCQRDNFTCSQDVTSQFSKAYEQNIFLFKGKTLASRVNKNSPLFRKVEIKKRLPNELLIEIDSRQPFAILETESGQEAVVDESGFVFYDNAEGLNLPRIMVSFTPTVGEMVSDKTVLQSLELVKLLQISYLNFEYINYPDNGGLQVFFGSGITATFSASKDLAGQVDSLQYILRRSRMEDKAIQAIDLRFQKPVLKFVN